MLGNLNFVLLVLFNSLVLTSSLQCYKCDILLILDDILTDDNIPSISTSPQCSLVTASRCRVWFQILLNVKTSIIGVEIETGGPSPSINNSSEEIVTGGILLNSRFNDYNTSLSHSVSYESNSKDKSNDENTIKRLLHSVKIEDEFQQTLSALLDPVPSFDPKTAECLIMNNMTTSVCVPPLYESCKRCEIINKKDEFCATCNSDAFVVNSIERTKTFVLNNRTQDFSSASLNCQKQACNTGVYLNLAYQTSRITFDSSKFK